VPKDPESEKTAQQIEKEAQQTWGVWKTLIRSRTLKDVFHVFNMLYLSVNHGLTVEFVRALRDILYIPDPVDKAHLVVWGAAQSPPLSWEDLLRTRWSWVWRRCKSIIPPAEELWPLIVEPFKTFGPLKDAKTGLPLFNTAAWAVRKNIIELAQKGYISDPHGIPLYYILGFDKWLLPLYRCVRGTNLVEGGVHTHLRSRLPTSGASIRHVNASLRDFILRHNLLVSLWANQLIVPADNCQVGTFNSTGKRFKGHFSIWITNELQELLSYVAVGLNNPKFLENWVNGNLYEPTNEVTGVLPVTEDVRNNAGMAVYDKLLDGKRPHHHLASLQGTRKAILPVCSEPEKDLFRQFMQHPDSSFGNFSSSISVMRGVQLWNRTADTRDNIFYKVYICSFESIKSNATSLSYRNN
jgi:hypothetical protein